MAALDSRVFWLFVFVDDLFLPDGSVSWSYVVGCLYDVNPNNIKGDPREEARVFCRWLDGDPLYPEPPEWVTPHWVSVISDLLARDTER